MLLIAGDSFGIKDHELIEKERAKMIFDVYDMMDVAAYGPGQRDLIYGLDFLKQLEAAHAFPVVCANLQNKRLGKNSLDTHVVVNKGGKKVLITAVVGTAMDLGKEGATLAIGDPLQAILDVQKKVDHDLFIVMAYVNHAQAEVWARKVKGIDMIVVGAQAGFRSGKRMINDTMIVFSNTQGATLSYIDLTFEEPLGIKTFSDPINLDLGVTKYAESPQVKAMIDQFKDNSTKMMRSRPSQGRMDLSMPARDGFFVGDQWCIRCHRDIYNSWQTTRHAQAMATLEKAGKADDPECLKCHTTGMNNKNMWFMGARAGFTSMETTPYLTNVQCEACHGPAQQHSIKPDQFTFYKVGPENCKRCHTSIRDKDFAYLRDKVKGTHLMGSTATANESRKDEAPSK